MFWKRTKKKIEQRLFTGYYENAKRLNLVLVSTTTKASRKLHESNTKAYTKARLGILVPVPFLSRADPHKPPMQDGGSFGVYRNQGHPTRV